MPKSAKFLDFKPLSNKDEPTRISPCTYKSRVLTNSKKIRCPDVMS